MTSSNIDAVIDSIDDVKDELPRRMATRLRRAQQDMYADVLRNVIQDPEASGQLRRAIEKDAVLDGTEMEFTVSANLLRAPYAAVVEFGSGNRTDKPHKGSKIVPPPSLEHQPPDYPYDSPDIDNISGFAYYIEQWMKKKNITPRYGFRGSALAIAETIIEQGTYAHSYLRSAFYQNEHNIRSEARKAVELSVS